MRLRLITSVADEVAAAELDQSFGRPLLTSPCQIPRQHPNLHRHVLLTSPRRVPRQLASCFTISGFITFWSAWTCMRQRMSFPLTMTSLLRGIPVHDVELQQLLASHGQQCPAWLQHLVVISALDASALMSLGAAGSSSLHLASAPSESSSFFGLLGFSW